MEKTDLPRFSVARFKSLSAKIKTTLIERNLQDTVLQELNKQAALDGIQKCIPKGNKISIVSILSQYMGETLTVETLSTLSQHLAGCSDMIESGELFIEWNPSKGPVWGFLYVQDVERSFTEKRMYRCRIKSFGGPTFNTTWVRDLPSRFVKMLIHECGGLLKEKYAYEDLGGLWFTAQLIRKNSRINFQNAFASNGQKRVNKLLLNKRLGKCLLDPSMKCFNCQRNRDECLLSRHQREYPRAICFNKKPVRHYGYIVRQGYCLGCLNAGRFPHKEKTYES